MVWDPYFAKDVHLIEVVQRTIIAARFVCQNFKCTASVTDMLVYVKHSLNVTLIYQVYIYAEFIEPLAHVANLTKFKYGCPCFIRPPLRETTKVLSSSFFL